MLNWFEANDENYLKSLPVLDENFEFKENFSDSIESLDLIIGADLVYFMESVEPLCQTLAKVFDRKPHITFYLLQV